MPTKCQTLRPGVSGTEVGGYGSCLCGVSSLHIRKSAIFFFLSLPLSWRMVLFLVCLSSRLLHLGKTCVKVNSLSQNHHFHAGNNLNFKMSISGPALLGLMVKFGCSALASWVRFPGHRPPPLVYQWPCYGSSPHTK